MRYLRKGVKTSFMFFYNTNAINWKKKFILPLTLPAENYDSQLIKKANSSFRKLVKIIQKCPAFMRKKLESMKEATRNVLH